MVHMFLEAFVCDAPVFRPLKMDLSYIRVYVCRESSHMDTDLYSLKQRVDVVGYLVPSPVSVVFRNTRFWFGACFWWKIMIFVLMLGLKRVDSPHGELRGGY